MEIQHRQGMCALHTWNHFSISLGLNLLNWPTSVNPLWVYRLRTLKKGHLNIWQRIRFPICYIALTPVLRKDSGIWRYYPALWFRLSCPRADRLEGTGHPAWKRPAHVCPWKRKQISGNTDNARYWENHQEIYKSFFIDSTRPAIRKQTRKTAHKTRHSVYTPKICTYGKER